MIVGSPNISFPFKRSENQQLNFALFETDPAKEEEIVKTAIINSEAGQSKDGKTVMTTTTELELKAPPAVLLRGGTSRVDYMVSIVAVCALMVTLVHYALTLLPALDSGYNAHYRCEIWSERALAHTS
jgi:hypothetical protein